MLKRVPINKASFLKVPQSPGVYLFQKAFKPNYIGKAVNLKARLLSYLQKNIGTKTRMMLVNSNSLSYILVNSELEALLLEAELIRHYQPKYNSVAKDDKHALYIKITNELYPRVLTARKIDAAEAQTFYGPFPSSTAVREVLRFLRRIFPYSDHKISKRRCLYGHLGLCNPCPSEIERKDPRQKTRLRKRYLTNIRMIKNVLSRKTDRVLVSLYKDMERLAKAEKFEQASAVREQINKLEYILQPINQADSFLENPNLLEDIRSEETKQLTAIFKNYLKVTGPIARIECFDVAHLAGTNPTASMVTFINGQPEKSLYRRFRIHQPKGSDDIASLAEVAQRRLKALDRWGKPDVVIVDGGIGQVGVFYRIFSTASIPVVGLAKRFETLVIPVSSDQTVNLKEVKIPAGAALNLLQRIRNEAHRFARRYHHLLVKKSLIS